MKRIAFKTLGCRLNQYETDALASQFQKGNYQLAGTDEIADAFIINTCTVTNQSDQKSRAEINKVLKKNKDSVVVVTGCMVNNQRESLEKKYDAVTYFVDNAQKTSIFNLVDAHFKGELVHPEDYDKDLFGFQAADKTFHTRSFIKIQDGCDNFCTFCIVPKVRGRATSRPVKDIISNIRKVVDFGYREIVLTGVNIGRYQYEDVNFEKLVEKILEIEGDFRVRISSIEADGYGEYFYDLFHHPKLMPHLHLCLQSGSDNILLKMRRFYDVKTFLAITESIKKRVSDFNFTTDIIVGFPGETEKDFQKTIDISKEIGFSHIHTFKYSVRNGTRAARMDNHIPEKLKTERSQIIRNLGEELKRTYRSRFIGMTQKVLVEKTADNLASGYGNHYVPVAFAADSIERNTFVDVKIQDIEQTNDPNLLGTLS